MASEQLRLVVVTGSTRSGRFGPTATKWFAEQARQHDGMDVDIIDLRDARLPERLGGLDDYPPAEVVALTPRLEAADAFVMVTPEYNHSFPASLKTAIDWFHSEWMAKPVGFVSYGGVAGGLRAVEHLRQVFAELHAVTIRDSVCFPNYWDRFDSHGRPTDSGSAVAAKAMLDQIAWWGRALRDARAKQPYEG